MSKFLEFISNTWYAVGFYCILAYVYYVVLVFFEVLEDFDEEDTSTETIIAFFMFITLPVAVVGLLFYLLQKLALLIKKDIKHKH